MSDERLRVLRRKAIATRNLIDLEQYILELERHLGVVNQDLVKDVKIYCVVLNNAVVMGNLNFLREEEAELHALKYINETYGDGPNSYWEEFGEAAEFLNTMGHGNSIEIVESLLIF